MPFTLNAVDDFMLGKVSEGEPIVVAETPVFLNELADVEYDIGDEAEMLDGTAEVSDGGRIRYSWKKDGTEVVPTAKYKPDTFTAGEYELELTATNRLGESTASASQTIKVVVKESVAAETPTFASNLEDVSYAVGDTATALDASATVSDGGTITYSWKDSDGNELATTAAYTPDTSTAGSMTLTVTATNTVGASTATASQTVVITVTE